ncbi:hypothetical protein BH10ACI3_BH10ACI3_06350 [soil metagenome]
MPSHLRSAIANWRSLTGKWKCPAVGTGSRRSLTTIQGRILSRTRVSLGRKICVGRMSEPPAPFLPEERWLKAWVEGAAGSQLARNNSTYRKPSHAETTIVILWDALRCPNPGRLITQAVLTQGRIRVGTHWLFVVSLFRSCLDLKLGNECPYFLSVPCGRLGFEERS